MSHRNIRRAIAGPLEFALNRSKLPHQPRHYQTTALKKVYDWLMDLNADRRAYIVHATGLGKSMEIGVLVTACEYVRVVVVVPTKQMVVQMVKDLLPYVGNKRTIAHASKLGNICDDRGRVLARHWKAKACDVLVVTDETFKSQHKKIYSVMKPGMILWDELQWAYTENAQNALKSFPDAVIVGFTATPDYLTTQAKSGYAPVTLDNGQVLYCPPEKMASTYFGQCLDYRGPRWGIENKWLAPLAWGTVELGFSLDDLPVTDTQFGADYNPEALAELMSQNWPLVIDVIRKLYKSNQYDLRHRYSAAMCPGVDEALEIAEALRSIGIKAESVVGTTDDDLRDTILQAGANRKLQFISSVFVLREGWNDPEAEIAMMLRPTKSRILYMQFMGRVLRFLKGKVAMVLDPHYHQTRFAPLSAPMIFGTPGQEVVNGGMLLSPRGGWARSPYQSVDLSRVKPVLKVVPIDIEYWAGEDGTFLKDGVRWANLRSASVILGIDRATIEARLPADIQRMTGRAFNGLILQEGFYPLNEIKRACSALIKEVPVAKANGTFECDGLVWANLHTASRILKVGRTFLENRLPFDIPRRDGKSFQGQLLRDGFFPLQTARECVKSYMMPKAGSDGLLKYRGKEWIAIKGAARMLRVEKKAIESRLPANIPRCDGKTVTGQVIPKGFILFSALKVACADLLEKLPQAGPDGTFRANGKTWISVGAAKRKLGIATGVLESRLSAGIPRRDGKGANGKLLKQGFLPLDRVVAACADLMEKRKRWKRR